ncbi:MAG: CPBP family intramembrane metalloprotease [Myxococcales bacterium]|nr:CPBP family intramembrane metalloprotease [Myxococcales bacterium]
MAPLRGGRDASILWLGVAVLGWGGVVGSGAAGPAGGVVAALGLAFALRPELPWPDRVMGLFVVAGGLLTAFAWPPIWPLAQLVMLAPAFLGARLSSALAPARRGLALGRLQLGPVVVLAVSAAVGLLAWWQLTGPDLAAARAMVPDWPLLAMVPAALGFSIVNAVLEEVAFRGLLQEALTAHFGEGWLPPLLSGIAFGLCHYHGFPSGTAGAVLAGGWGTLLGFARRRSGGLLTPVCGHVVADLVIFAILAWLPSP